MIVTISNDHQLLMSIALSFGNPSHANNIYQIQNLNKMKPTEQTNCK